MAFCVQILCPNGRRQTVKTNLNATLLQILEDCCKKHGFLPPEDYCFMHTRTQLDLSIALRYVNLPNNAQLELVKAKSSRKEVEVLIALQLSDGTRLQKAFFPAVSLLEIIEHWQKEADSSMLPFLSTEVDSSCQPPKHPVCVYLREEIIGEYALRITPLRKLGLTGGKAIIRLLHRQIDDVMYATFIQKLDVETNKKMRLDEIAARHLAEEMEEEKEETMEIDVIDGIPFDAIPCGAESNLPVSSADSSPAIVSPSSSVASASGIQWDNMDMDNTVATTTRSWQHVESLSSEGRVPPLGEEADRGSEQRHTACAPAVQHSIVSNVVTETQSFQPFRTFKFPEVTKKTVNKSDNYFSEISEAKREDFLPCDRNLTIYNPVMMDSSDTASMEEPSDDFYEITKSDMMSMMTDLRKKRRELDDQPLITKSLKEAMKNDKYSKYKQVVIRVHFPDHLVLQGFFRPLETVFSLHKFVRANLEDKNMEFNLYESPPKKVLSDMSDTLILANLAPASIVYFGTNVEKAHYLKSELIGGMVSKEDAEKSIECSELGTAYRLNETKKPTTTELSAPMPSTSGTQPARKSMGATEQKKTQTVPKWFKLGKR